MKSPLLVRGMHGLGDNLHQRAIIRQLMEKHEVWLESSWVSVYHDLIAQGLRVISKATPLRTQTKNANREVNKFSREPVPAGAKSIRVSYSPQAVRRTGSVLAAMCESVGVDSRRADFRLPIAPEWQTYQGFTVASERIMIYRPLTERKEWGGCRNRNPDPEAYNDLYEAIKDDYFTVAVADIDTQNEWMVGPQPDVDYGLWRGEFTFENLAAVFAIADMIYTPPGFAAVLAQAVGTPHIVVFGGYENGRSFSLGRKFAPYLPIEPIKPCNCFSHTHACAKQIDISLATIQVKAFAEANRRIRT